MNKKIYLTTSFAKVYAREKLIFRLFVKVYAHEM